MALPNLYHQGPEYLSKPEAEWPHPPDLEPVEVEVELRKSIIRHLTDQPGPAAPNGPNVEDCRTIEELQRLTFRKHSPHLDPETPLSAADYAIAEVMVLQRVQREVFPQEMACLERGVDVPHDSRLRQLAPELDDHGLIRVGGRLRRAQDLTEDHKHPIVLPQKHLVTDLVIKQHDTRLHHPGSERLFTELRRRYWILRGREAVRRYQGRCTECRKLRASPIIPKMSDLPANRLQIHKAPFHHTGMDCFGPYSVRAEVGRTTAKRWGIVFKCLTSNAIHLEVLADLSAASFLMSFRRFTGRRGRPGVLLSDNGTNFHGGEAELKKNYRDMTAELKDHLAPLQVDFQYNPPSAPHFGGVWEREVRSVKAALNFALGGQVPKAEVFATVLVEVEAILNSKPLGYASSDLADLDPVTPNSLLMGGPCLAAP